MGPARSAADIGQAVDCAARATLPGDIWIDRFRGGNVSISVVHLAQFQLRDPAVVERFSVAGFQFDRPIVVLDGTFVLALVPVGDAAVVESPSISRIEIDGAIVVL